MRRVPLLGESAVAPGEIVVHQKLTIYNGPQVTNRSKTCGNNVMRMANNITRIAGPNNNPRPHFMIERVCLVFMSNPVSGGPPYICRLGDVHSNIELCIGRRFKLSYAESYHVP